jgi:hypothetical protein
VPAVGPPWQEAIALSQRRRGVLRDGAIPQRSEDDETMRCIVSWAHTKRTWIYAKLGAPRLEARHRMWRAVRPTHGLPRKAPAESYCRPVRAAVSPARRVCRKTPKSGICNFSISCITIIYMVSFSRNLTFSTDSGCRRTWLLSLRSKLCRSWMTRALDYSDYMFV